MKCRVNMTLLLNKQTTVIVIKHPKVRLSHSLLTFHRVNMAFHDGGLEDLLNKRTTVIPIKLQKVRLF